MNTEIGDFTIGGVTILVTMAVWLIVDVYLYATSQPTISAKMYKWNKYINPIGYLLMFLMGHWLWAFAMFALVPFLSNTQVGAL
jgi:hypothetical protein